jgi:hypothetical protein
MSTRVVRATAVMNWKNTNAGRTMAKTGSTVGRG